MLHGACLLRARSLNLGSRLSREGSCAAVLAGHQALPAMEHAPSGLEPDEPQAWHGIHLWGRRPCLCLIMAPLHVWQGRQQQTLGIQYLSWLSIFGSDTGHWPCACCPPS